MKNVFLLLAGLFCVIRQTYAQDGIRFAADFAPSQRATAAVERPFRDDTCLNGSWKFMPVALDLAPDPRKLEQPIVPSDPQWSATPLRIPSPWNVNSFAGGHEGGDFVTYPDYPAEWDTVRAGWLMRNIPYKKSWAGRRLILHFEAVAGYTCVFVNGRAVGHHFDNFLPFDIDITDDVRPAGGNELLVWVASARLFDKRGPYGRRPYVGGSFWGQHIAGIWQDVDLLVRPVAYIAGTFVQPFVSRDTLSVTVTLHNSAGRRTSVRLSGSIRPWINTADTSVIGAPEPRWRLGQTVLALEGPSLTLPPHGDTTVTFSSIVRGRLALWSPDTPHLYGIVVRMAPNDRLSTANSISPSGRRAQSAANSGPDKEIDLSYTRFGWREATIRNGQFLLNGQPLILKGDSWHFMGIPQMTRRYAWAWYTMLKAAHANAVRLHAEPYPVFYLDVADEMGMLVLDETAMWASDGGPDITSDEYWKAADDHLGHFILRDRNHPSVFGWSVCNENIPVAVNVFHAPESLVQRQLKAIDNWTAIARAMDPTRNWISGDGETGRPTDLPTIIGHYGGEADYRQWSSAGRLWGIGESGMAYYGTPRQASAFNGDASYVSQEGRMEGVAAEATHLVNLQKKYHAVYRSVFNLVWYGLQPLELGLADTLRAPMSSDGIFFHPFREGQPGIQPGRLGPYTTTLNPGYDPGLPLYRPWPLFTALAAAYGESGEEQEPVPPSTAAAGVAAATGSATGVAGSPIAAGSVGSTVGVVNSATAAGRQHESAIRLVSADGEGLDTLLRNLGASLAAGPSDHIIIDGIHLPDSATLAHVLATAGSGSSILIWGLRPSGVPVLNQVLPEKVTVTDRKATSYIPMQPDGLLQGLGNPAWYFSELTRRPVSEYAMTGDIVQKGKILLAACNTDWQRWNGRPEYSKTAAVIRSEREAKPAGSVLVEYVVGRGRIYLLSIDPDMQVSKTVIRQLLVNWGAQLTDSAGLSHSSISGHRYSAFDDRGVWHVQAASRLNFWLYSPRSLVNLLVEPDLPTLNMQVSGSDEWQLRVNGKVAVHSSRPEALPLQKGWNHLVLEIRHPNNQPLTVQLTSTVPAFLSTLRSAVNAPDTESISNDDAHE